MRRGRLSQYFKNIGFKELSIVETIGKKSNQHEINGVSGLLNIFGKAGDKKQRIDTTFLFVGDGDDDYDSIEGTITRYDARANNPKRTEHRLYYETNEVTAKMKEGDLLIIAQLKTGSVLFLVVEKKSSILMKINWLFGLKNSSTSFQIKNFDKDDKEINYVSRFILDELGLQVDVVENSLLNLLIEKFGGESMPSTKIFSEFAREHANIKNSINADELIMVWMDQEEILFKTYERYIVSNKLKTGDCSLFDPNSNEYNVDNLIKFSLSIQNRRKSRVGHALEHHLEKIFQINNLKYSRGKKTEGKSKPDFIFPSINYYHNLNVPSEHLSMLGVKSTCKDRRRQVLSEADRIKSKYLFTLQPSISVNQTNEMKNRNLQLVVPNDIMSSYTKEQQSWLMSLSEYIKLIKDKERTVFALYG